MFPFKLACDAAVRLYALSARAAVMLPYNVERIPVQRAWETLSAEHLQELGIDPGECISSSR